MSRRSSLRREFSIPGDELERHRIQLEHNLQNTDLSLHLSSGPDDDANNESVEYPRHNSVPKNFSGFVSFNQRSPEDLDLDTSQLHAWSIHDDEGITPYDVRTMSTAAHHASAVTITAGLRRGVRREPSISGAEYDPERPLQDILAACNAEPESDDADKSQDMSRPRLSESLQRVGFSPKRPRNVQPRSSYRTAHPIAEVSPRHTDGTASRRNVTPRTRKSATVSFDTTATPSRRHVSQPVIVQPRVNIQPPTPSTSGSRFTKMARGLTRDVRQAQDNWKAQEGAPPGVPIPHTALEDAEICNIADAAINANHVSRTARKAGRSRIYLPDVTGLTNAVISPAKAHLERHTIRGSSSKEIEARLIASLNALHTRLNHLETENSIARRRVRELEFELEECKRDVVRERTRIVESDDAVDDSAARLPWPSGSRSKGKEKKHRETDLTSSKYYEVVEEKKALEALIATLRTHLSRVTSDLSSQQQLLDDLRRLRESDALSLTEKAQEINQLRTEVERLAGEIEVLRSIVEEGLNERRQGRDNEHNTSVDSPKLSRFIDDDELDRISIELDERRSERLSHSSANALLDESPDAGERLPVSRTTIDPVEDAIDEVSAGLPVRQFVHQTVDPNTQIQCPDGEDEGLSRDSNRERAHTLEEILETMDRNGGKFRPGDLPPQTVLARVVGELEEEFGHFREIYSNLAEEYRQLDSATQSAERHAVSDRLRDVIEVLERKGNQISSLYDLLVFKDKPIA